MELKEASLVQHVTRGGELVCGEGVGVVGVGRASVGGVIIIVGGGRG